jgi:hypothetical protein
VALKLVALVARAVVASAAAAAVAVELPGGFWKEVLREGRGKNRFTASAQDKKIKTN